MEQQYQCLSPAEVLKFTTALDKNNDGFIEYEEVQSMLDEVHEEIAGDPKHHHLHHQSRSDDDTHRFLRSIMGTTSNHISVADFSQTVERWNVPSLEQDKSEEEESKHYLRSAPLSRRLHAYWSVQGPEIMFIALVVAMQMAFGIWQMVKYIVERQWRRALGWGVVLSKTSAGVRMYTLLTHQQVLIPIIVYPTMFFLIISMSRYLSTFLRSLRPRL